MRTLTISLLSLLLVLPAVAQDVVDEAEEPEIRRYTVEVVIFRYTQDVGVGSERFLPDEPEPVPEQEELPQDDELVSIEDPAPLEDEDVEPPPDIELVLLEEDDYQMVEILDRLEKLDVYEPIMHFGWIQATWPREQTEALPLHRFAEVPEGLDGTLTLYLSRFLHLVVDLQLDAPLEDDVEYRPSPGYGDFELLQDHDAQAPLPVRYLIQEDRILRNGELRYYDHPKFGLLAKVTRVEEEEESPEAGELLGYPLQ